MSRILKRMRLWLIPVALILISLGFVTMRDKDFEIVKHMDIFYSLFKELTLFYVDETKPEKLIESAIEGMLSDLDPYTSYVPEKDMEDLNFMTTGEYGGIGALIRKGGAYAIISEPYEGFPAQQGGLRAGDTILSIDGVSTRGKEISQVSDLLKGTPNTELEIEIKRVGGNGVQKKNLTRRKISIPNVPYSGMLEKNVGYIRLSNFTRDAGMETQQALKSLIEQGATSVILDLRHNPGGLLIESVMVSNLFVPRDVEIVSTRGKVKQWDNTYKTVSQPVDLNIPLVVLVNRASASASEIVAGAIQDLDRGVIIGQRTFGKGLVQTTRPLSYNSQLKVTTAKYYIPSGRCIQAVDYSNRNEDGSVGVIPDSLIREFETKSGRKVFDGGGITPDIALPAEQYGNITISLYSKNLIFDFATLYASRYPSLSAEMKPNERDLIFEEFVKYLKDKNFDYTTESDESLKSLVSVAKKEKYYDLAIPEFEALKKKLAHDKDKDLQTFRTEISELLYQEIASRYFYQKGRIRVSLQDDPEVDKAIEVLTDPKTYQTLLQPSGISEIARN